MILLLLRCAICDYAAMYIEIVPNRNSPPAILLRESYRDAGKIKKRTIANLSDWPTELVEGLRTLLKGGNVPPAGQEGIIDAPRVAARPCRGGAGHAAQHRPRPPAGAAAQPLPRSVMAMIVARLHRAGLQAGDRPRARSADCRHPASARCSASGRSTRTSSTPRSTGSRERQPAIEKALARKHLHDGTLVLYDVSSSYVEGRCCELARLGYNRDGKKGKLQIVYGLLCAADGCPVAIEVFEGDTGDPKHACGPDRQGQEALRARARGAGRRSRHDHAGAHRRRDRAGRARLDHGVARAGDQGAGRGRRLADRRCSTSATWRRSRRPIIRASG